MITFTGLGKPVAFLVSVPGMCKSFADTESQHIIYWDFPREFVARWRGEFCRSPIGIKLQADLSGCSMQAGGGRWKCGSAALASPVSLPQNGGASSRWHTYVS